MAIKTLTTRVRLKMDTEANWLASSIILMPGELAFVVDKLDAPTTVKIKCGDGSTSFANLPYATQPPEELTTVVQEAVEAEFDKRFADGLLLQCGGADTTITPPPVLTEEVLNEAVDNVLTEILNTEY